MATRYDATMAKGDPDFAKLRSVNDELTRLVDEGTVTKADFDRLYGEASAAVGEHTQFLEGMMVRGFDLGFIEG